MRATLHGRPQRREHCDFLNHLRTTLITTASESDSVSRVSEIAPRLPTDIEALQALVAAACAERDVAIAERDQALSQIDRLRHLLRQLQRAQFGRRSEKLDPEQLLLALEDIEQAIAGNEAADDKKDAVAARARAEKRRVNRGALPAHLPHVDVTIEPEDTNCPCCSAPMHLIGEETSQRLDVVPAQFRVIVTHRPKYACRAWRAGGG
jgi:transposase